MFQLVLTSSVATLPCVYERFTYCDVELYNVFGAVLVITNDTSNCA